MKVVSFCHYLQGPAAMQYLADMGAEVIKIEPPNGAFERRCSLGFDKVGIVSRIVPARIGRSEALKTQSLRRS